MKKTLLAMAFAAFIAPIAAQATESNGIGYTYVQLDYVNVSQSGHGAYADGASLSGSYQFANNFQVFGSYTDTSLDKGYIDRQIGSYDGVHVSGKDRPWSLGFGYAASIGSRADWVTQIAYAHDRYSLRGCFDGWGCERYRDSANIWSVNTGVMGRVTDNLTANAYIGYSNGDEGVQGNVYGDFGLVYSFNPTWALHGGVHLNNNSTQTYSVGVRASF